MNAIRFELNEELDVYEVFSKWGLGDGDHPLAGEVRNRVYGRLIGLGWEYRDVSTIHNYGYISRLRCQDTVREGNNLITVA